VAEPTLYLFDGYNLLHAGGFEDVRELRDTLASFVAVLSVPGRGQEAGIAKDNKATTADKPNNDGQTRPPAVEAGDRAADHPRSRRPSVKWASNT